MAYPCNNSSDIVLIALLDDPHYVKALERRAAANDTLNSWSSLTTVEEGSLFHIRKVNHI
jgi:hypothetical protein